MISVKDNQKQDTHALTGTKKVTYGQVITVN